MTTNASIEIFDVGKDVPGAGHRLLKALAGEPSSTGALASVRARRTFSDLAS
jgi:hypothetical protein